MRARVAAGSVRVRSLGLLRLSRQWAVWLGLLPPDRYWPGDEAERGMGAGAAFCAPSPQNGAQNMDGRGRGVGNQTPLLSLLS